MKYVFLLLTSFFLFVACSNPETEAQIEKKQHEVEMYQGQIKKVEKRLDSLKAADQKLQEDLKNLDMAR